MTKGGGKEAAAGLSLYLPLLYFRIGVWPSQIPLFVALTLDRKIAKG